MSITDILINYNNNERNITMDLIDILFGAYAASLIIEDEYAAEYEEIIEGYEDKIEELKEQILLLSEKKNILSATNDDEDY